MSVPIKELITLDIEAAINAITVANGFNQNLTAVRPRRNDFSDVSPVDGIVLIKQADEEKADNPANGTEEWYQPYALMAIVLDSDTATESIDTLLNTVAADIVKKLKEDPYRDSNAIDTITLPATEFNDGQGFSGVAVGVAVQYRTQENDPYTKG